MNNKKNGTMAGIIYLVIFIAYNLAVFMMFKNHNNIFWISYGFMLSAFLIHICCVYFIAKNLSVQALFFGISLLSFSVYFMCAEFFCSFVFMTFSGQAPVKAAILIQGLLLCLFIVIALISIMTRDTVQNVDNKIKENVNFIKGLNVDVEMMIQNSQSPDVTAVLHKLSETIKYSDPMSSNIVASQEQMIIQNMMKIRDAFDSGDMETTKGLCRKIELLFIERNKKLMISK